MMHNARWLVLLAMVVFLPIGCAGMEVRLGTHRVPTTVGRGPDNCRARAGWEHRDGYDRSPARMGGGYDARSLGMGKINVGKINAR